MANGNIDFNGHVVIPAWAIKLVAATFVGMILTGGASVISNRVELSSVRSSVSESKITFNGRLDRIEAKLDRLIERGS